jgi:hypothetical protein
MASASQKAILLSHSCFSRSRSPAKGALRHEKCHYCDGYESLDIWKLPAKGLTVDCEDPGQDSPSMACRNQILL